MNERKQPTAGSADGGFDLDGSPSDYRERDTRPPSALSPGTPRAIEADMVCAEQAVLGDYLLLEEIGSGGMGQVFKARHQRMERVVALKVLSAAVVGDPKAVARFHREVKAAAKLFHPNIVTAFDAGEQEGTHYLVMEYVDGCSLSALVEQQGPLAPQTAVQYLLQAAAGLQYAHSRNVVHRDIKPNNLMASSDGVIKILDMGLARFQDDGGGTSSMYRLTQTGIIMGTVGYMSPEQITDASRADHRTDIYSLGCTLYFLLTGRPVFSGDMVETVMGHVAKPIPALRAARRDVSETLEGIYQRMLAKNPEHRYQTISELIVDLKRCGLDTSRDGPLSVARAAAPHVAVAATRDTVLGGAKESSTIAPQAPAIGIEFGTTASAIARIDEAGRPLTLKNRDGDAATLSMVLIDCCPPTSQGKTSGESKTPDILLGEGAGITVGKNVLHAPPAKRERVTSALKRELGRKIWHRFRDGCEYPPEVLSATILRKLADDARRQVGQFRHVVIAVPACFDEAQRKGVQDAAYIAGLTVLELISEPLAAAIVFADKQGCFDSSSAPRASQKAVFYDLGGGVFDVSIAEISPSRISVLATDGDSSLGGHDWDSRLMDWVAEQFVKEHGLDPRQDEIAVQRLWRKCEVAKRTLSVRDQVEMVYDFKRKTSRFSIRRETLERLTQDLLERTVELTLAALKSAGLDWSQIDHAVLVGGGSRMPMVRERICKLSGREPNTLLSMDKAVAQGAATYAAIQLGNKPSLSRLEITDVSSRHLGVVGVEKRTGRKRMGVVIPRNTPLPATVQQTFKTQKEGQQSLRLHIIQGNSDSADDCTSIGKLSIVHLHPEIRAGSPLNVEFRLTRSGRLELSVPRGEAPQVKRFFTRTSGLSSEQLEFWHEWLETMLLCSHIY